MGMRNELVVGGEDWVGGGVYPAWDGACFLFGGGGWAAFCVFFVRGGG